MVRKLLASVGQKKRDLIKFMLLAFTIVLCSWITDLFHKQALLYHKPWTGKSLNLYAHKRSFIGLRKKIPILKKKKKKLEESHWSSLVLSFIDSLTLPHAVT